jgi:RNA polymerase sigma-70 factor (ECF subfamily)
VSGMLDLARGGDERAYDRLVEPYRAELRAHCYRMLGSAHDAEDVLQEALLRAWRALPGLQARSSLRTWLYTIATNACLRAIERRPKLVLPIDYGPPGDPHGVPAAPLVESVWLEPIADDRLAPAAGLAAPEARYEQRESVELAFIAALQHLPARQRAVLILRDVLGFSAREVAETLHMTPPAVDSALQRAHRSVDERLPQRSQQSNLRTVGDERLHAVVDEFVAAWERADVDAVVALLAEDAALAMPPTPTWFRGRAAIATFLAAYPLTGELRWRTVLTGANGQLALAHYAWRDEPGRWEAHSIDVLTFEGAQIAQITVFMAPGAVEGFGLPGVID